MPIRPRRCYGGRRTRWRWRCGTPSSVTDRADHRPDRTSSSSGRGDPANDKIVSLFESDANIVVKGGREVQCGHELNLTTGRSGLILDLVIEAGNPADSEHFLPMLDRHIGFHDDAPRQTAADSGFASRHNLGEAKALGVRDVAFHKGRPAGRHGHGQEQLGLSQAAQLPSRHRIRHLVLEARLWSGALHLARARPLQGMHLVISRGLQPAPFARLKPG